MKTFLALIFTFVTNLAFAGSNSLDATPLIRFDDAELGIRCEERDANDTCVIARLYLTKGGSTMENNVSMTTDEVFQLLNPVSRENLKKVHKFDPRFYLLENLSFGFEDHPILYVWAFFDCLTVPGQFVVWGVKNIVIKSKGARLRKHLKRFMLDGKIYKRGVKNPPIHISTSDFIKVN